LAPKEIKPWTLGDVGTGIGKGYNWLKTHTLTGDEIKDPKPDVDLYGTNKKFKYKPDSRRADDYKTGKRSFLGEVWDELKGETVGGQPIRTVEGLADPVKPSTPKGPKTSKPRGPSVTKTTTVRAPVASSGGGGNGRDARFDQLYAEENRRMSSQRGGGDNARDRAARRLAKEEGRVNSTAYRRGETVATAKKRNSVHNTKGLKWFRGGDD
jgi:hypothetical protein